MTVRRRGPAEEVDGSDPFTRWLEKLPGWLRPAAYGPLLLALLISTKAGGPVGLAVVGVVAVVLLLRSRTPIDDLGNVLLFLAIAFLGSALGGLGYSLLGRFVRRIPLVGPYVAGVVVVAPYFAGIGAMSRLADGESLFAAPTDTETSAVAVMSLIFGPVLGHALFRPSAQAGGDLREG